MKKHILTATIYACLSTHVLAEDNTTTPVDKANNRVQLNNIVVKGEKETKTLKDTSSSVAVIHDEELNSTQYQSFQDVIATVPNVVVETGSVPNVRGITGNGAAGGFLSVTGGANARFTTLIDGVAQPFVADLTGSSGLWDLEQVEVYRGPQSTNNGRNSIAGAMYIKTKDPSFDWDGAVRLGYRNKDKYFDKAVMLSGPIIEDTLAFRFAGQAVDGETTTSNEPFSTNPTNLDLNELDTQQGRYKLLWTPTDDFKALFTYSKYKEEGDAGRRYFRNDGVGGYNKIDSLIRDMDTENETFSLDMSYQLNDSMSVDMLVSKMNYQLSFDSYDPLPSSKQSANFSEDNKDLDIKLNFGQDSDVFNGLIGLSYFKRDQSIKSLGGSVYSGDDDSNAKALYSELNFGLAEKWLLTTGLRYQKEEQDRHFDYTSRNISADLKEDNKILLPSVALKYALSDTSTVGISYRKGYNSGGGALDITAGDYYYYDEERVDTYEIFSRNEFDDGRYTLNANIFFNEYDGYQGVSSRRIINIDTAETYGAELEGVAWVTDDVEVTASLGLLHTEVIDGGDDYTSATGNQLSTAPKKTANLGATYFLTDNFNFGGNIQYIGGYYGDIDNSDDQKVGGYSVINLRANYEIGQLSLSAYVNNVTDKYAERVVYPITAQYTQGFKDVIDPRTVGIAATYSFF